VLSMPSEVVVDIDPCHTDVTNAEKGACIGSKRSFKHRSTLAALRRYEERLLPPLNWPTLVGLALFLTVFGAAARCMVLHHVEP
jgi:hypothetical protein